MSARDVAEGERHREHRQAEGERHPDEGDAQFRESRREHRAAAAAQHEPEGAQEFDAQTLSQRGFIMGGKIGFGECEVAIYEGVYCLLLTRHLYKVPPFRQ